MVAIEKKIEYFQVESDEESNAGLPRNFKMSDILIYQNLKNHESSETTTEEKIADSLNINQGLISELLTLQRFVE